VSCSCVVSVPGTWLTPYLHIMVDAVTLYPVDTQLQCLHAALPAALSLLQCFHAGEACMLPATAVLQQWSEQCEVFFFILNSILLKFFRFNRLDSRFEKNPEASTRLDSPTRSGDSTQHYPTLGLLVFYLALLNGALFFWGFNQFDFTPLETPDDSEHDFVFWAAHPNFYSPNSS